MWKGSNSGATAEPKTLKSTPSPVHSALQHPQPPQPLNLNTVGELVDGVEEALILVLNIILVLNGLS